MKTIQKQTTYTIILLLSFLGLMIVSTNSMMLEAFLQYVSARYALIIGPLVRLIPFSISELSWIVCIIFVVFSLMKAIHFFRYRRWKKAFMTLHKMMNITFSLATLYIATTGLAYARDLPPIPQWNEHVNSTQYEPILLFFHEDFTDVATSLSFDDQGSVINPYPFSELNDLIQHQFSYLDDAYYYPFSTTLKPMLFSFLYAEFHITGIHNGLTTEALFNANIPDALLPFTMAHELAHAKGVMREEDANLVAMYLCLTSEDAYVRYSGYFYTFYAVLNLMRFVGDDQAYSRYYQALPVSIRNDYRYQTSFWGQYTLLNDIATFINDVYLRIMGNEGVTSYVDAPQTGTIVENGQTIEVITKFSPFQRLYFWLYYQSQPNP